MLVLSLWLVIQSINWFSLLTKPFRRIVIINSFNEHGTKTAVSAIRLFVLQMVSSIIHI